MSARFEIVEGDDDTWQARLLDDDETAAWVTPTYGSKTAAIQAVQLLAGTFAPFAEPQLAEDDSSVEVALDHEPLGQRLVVSIAHVPLPPPKPHEISPGFGVSGKFHRPPGQS